MVLSSRSFPAILIIGSVAATLVVMSAGCDGPRQRAKALLSDYVVAEAVQAAEAQRRYVVSEDRAVLDEQLSKERSVLDSVRMAEVAREKLAESFQVEIESLERTDGEMRVTAEVTRPDIAVLQGVLVGQTMKAAKGESNASEKDVREAMLQAIADALEEREFPTQTDTETFVLRKEEGEWRIDRDLEGRQKLKEQIAAARKHSIDGRYEQAVGRAEVIAEKIDSSDYDGLKADWEELRVSILSGQAREAEKEEAYERAIEKYREIVKIDPKGPFAPLNAEQARQKAESLRRQMKAAESADGGVEESDAGSSSGGREAGAPPDAGGAR